MSWNKREAPWHPIPPKANLSEHNTTQLFYYSYKGLSNWISNVYPFSRRNLFPYPCWSRTRLQGRELQFVSSKSSGGCAGNIFKGKEVHLVTFIQIRKNYWHGGSGLNFTDSFQMSSFTCSSAHVGWSKSKLNGLGQTGSSLMLWSDERYGWHSASSTAYKWKYHINMKQMRLFIFTKKAINLHWNSKFYKDAYQ